MIKCILFDFDGVLTIDKTGSTSITNYISQEMNLPLETIKTSYYKYNKKLLMGEIVHKDMWDDFCNDVGMKIPYQVLIDSFRNTVLDEKMFNYIKVLKGTYRIGMVTDNKADRIEAILDYRNYKRYFDIVAISAKVHSGKDDSRIFQYALDALNVSAEECIFIDNTAKNLIVPADMGMRTILFDDERRDFESFVESMMLKLFESSEA